MRALAIIFVVSMHINENFLSGQLPKTIINNIPPFKGGWVGVPMFFVLSGFLIGGQLWDEYLKTGSINFSKFILKRGFRIWPLYYFILIIFYLFNINDNSFFSGIISNIFFLSNYWSDNGPIYGAWSLATEEQFYIIAPLLILFFKDKNLIFYRKYLYFLFFVPLLARIITWAYFNESDTFDLNTYMQFIYRPIHTNCEGLIIGMIIANIIRDKTFKINKFLANRNIVFIASVLLMLLSFKDKIYFNFTGVALGFGALLWLILDHTSVLSKVLSHPIWFPIAKTSFATYLIHKPIISFILSHDNLLQGNINSFFLPFIYLTLTIVISLFISTILYCTIERPFMLLRGRFMKSR